MNNGTYQQIKKFLENEELPYALKTERDRKSFKNFIKPFELVGSQLFRKSKYREARKVLQQEKIDAYLYLFHDDPVSGHLGVRKVFMKLKRGYYWPNMYWN